MKYLVKVHYSGDCQEEVEADSEEAAKDEAAEIMAERIRQSFRFSIAHCDSEFTTELIED